LQWLRMAEQEISPHIDKGHFVTSQLLPREESMFPVPTLRDVFSPDMIDLVDTLGGLSISIGREEEKMHPRLTAIGRRALM
jgi:hypothetical protein